MKNIRAFTLIELLVVISIIGILASVVLSSVISARDKGVIASGVQFADTNYHAYGADALVMYNFNDLSGVGSTPSSLLDTSGNSFNITCYSSGVTLSSDNPAGSSGNLSGNFTVTSFAYGTMNGGCSVALPTTFGAFSPSMIHIGSYTLPVFTMSGWVKLTTMPNNGKPNIIEIADGLSGENIHVENSLKKIYCTANSYNGSPVASVTLLQTNKWYHVACSLDVSKNLILYINGVKEGTKPSVDALDWPTTDSPYVDIWSNLIQSSAPGTGYLDDVAIYTRSLTSSDIHRMFAEGAAKHGIALAK